MAFDQKANYRCTVIFKFDSLLQRKTLDLCLDFPIEIIAHNLPPQSEILSPRQFPDSYSSSLALNSAPVTRTSATLETFWIRTSLREAAARWLLAVSWVQVLWSLQPFLPVRIGCARRGDNGGDMQKTDGASTFGASLVGRGFDVYKFVRQPQTIVRFLSWVSACGTSLDQRLNTGVGYQREQVRPETPSLQGRVGFYHLLGQKYNRLLRVSAAISRGRTAAP